MKAASCSLHWKHVILGARQFHICDKSVPGRGRSCRGPLRTRTHLCADTSDFYHLDGATKHFPHYRLFHVNAQNTVLSIYHQYPCYRPSFSKTGIQTLVETVSVSFTWHGLWVTAVRPHGASASWAGRLAQEHQAPPATPKRDVTESVPISPA